MRQEITDGDLARDPGIGELKSGQVFLHGIVPIEAALTNKDSDRRRGERLGGRTDRKQGVLVDRRWVFHFAYSVARRQDHRVAMDDRQREAGHAPIPHVGGDPTIEIRKPVPLLPGGRMETGFKEEKNDHDHNSRRFPHGALP